jgi:Zn-finger nucleic acid-binding protein
MKTERTKLVTYLARYVPIEALNRTSAFECGSCRRMWAEGGQITKTRSRRVTLRGRPHLSPRVATPVRTRGGSTRADSGIACGGLVTGRSPRARTRRAPSSAASPSSTCPRGRPPWSGPRRSPPPAAVRRRSARSCSIRLSDRTSLPGKTCPAAPPARPAHRHECDGVWSAGGEVTHLGALSRPGTASRRRPHQDWYRWGTMSASWRAV